MKKIFYIILLIIIIALVVVAFVVTNKKTEAPITTTSGASTTKSNHAKSTTIQLTDDYFLTKINDIYINYNDYEGKTLSYEGFIYYDERYDCMIIARYYYCCGYDSYIAGMECDYSGEELPADTWVKVTGTIRINKDNLNDIYPYLEVTSLEQTEEGERYVTN